MPRVATTSTSRVHQLPTKSATHRNTSARRSAAPIRPPALQMETHYIAKHTGLKPHICKKCVYCAADPSTLHRHMRAKHAYIPGTEPRMKRSTARSSTIPVILEPTFPASPSADSDYSEASSESWSTYTSPASSMDSPSFSTASDDQFAPTHLPNSGRPLLSRCVFCIFILRYLPILPADLEAWGWDADFEAAVMRDQSTCVIVEPTPDLGLAILYPAHDITFFDGGCNPAFFSTSFETQQSLSYDTSLLFLPHVYDPTLYPFESSVGVNSVFEGEWTDVVN
ncbi:hypothetical protein B0H13DRAFT_1909351 [Mycena leptocephala]|nr:hypothetical protein B0H13DRAFT_1909351 [Mycena leptocephala]